MERLSAVDEAFLYWIPVLRALLARLRPRLSVARVDFKINKKSPSPDFLGEISRRGCEDDSSRCPAGAAERAAGDDGRGGRSHR